jgi:hypothetical protein
MTSGYQKSRFQTELERHIAGIDRNAPGFLESAPFVINCLGEAAEFRTRVPPIQQAAIEARHAKGNLSSVSELLRPARDYAMEKLRQRFEDLDPEALGQLRAVLLEWRAGRTKLGRAVDSGVEIILPVSGIRLAYDDSDLRQFA